MVVPFVAVIGLLCTVGGDSRWLAVRGDALLGGSSHPLPYTSDADAGWPPVLDLAALLFRAAATLPGERGYQLLQCLAVAAALTAISVDARRRGAAPASRVAALLAVLLGAAASLLVVRLQLFSIALLPVLLLMLRRETARPSRQVWWVPALLAVWSNLHGGVLVGVAVAAAYLVVERSRQDLRTAGACLVAVLIAPLATPALLGAFGYYQGVVTNEAARRSEGLWAPLDPMSPFDVAFVLVAVLLAVLAWRSGPRAWEVVAAVGLGLLTIQAARNGVWLLLLLAAPAAAGLRWRPPSLPRVATHAVVALSVVVLVAALGRGPLSVTAGPELVARAVDLAGSSPVMAEDALGERVAVAGGCVWVTNPLDAYPRALQQRYLDVTAGQLDALPDDVRVVLAAKGGALARAAGADPGFTLVASDGAAEILVREAPASAAPCPARRP